jgi:DNA-binding winged helix-turn-helix (wHTH) protein
MRVNKPEETETMEGPNELVVEAARGECAKPARRYTYFGAFQLDMERRRLLRDGIRVPLGLEASKLLTLLISRACRIVTDAEIRSTLWDKPGSNWLKDIKRTALELKTALEDVSLPPRYIEHIKDQGYVFVAELEVSDVPRQTIRKQLKSHLIATKVEGREPSPPLDSVDFPPKQSNTRLILAVAQLVMAGMLFGSGIELLWEFGAPARSFLPFSISLFFPPMITALFVLALRCPSQNSRYPWGAGSRRNI